jgi:hypothetical protein
VGVSRLIPPQFLATLEHGALAGAMRGEHGWEWLFPIIETLHVMGLAVLFGSILMLDLRLMGLSSRNTPVVRLTGEILPYTWTAFAAAAATGSLLFISRATVYLANPQFELKLLCIIVAGINMAVFRYGIYRRASQWDDGSPPPPAAWAAGALSIVLWLGVILFGRWTGFTT